MVLDSKSASHLWQLALCYFFFRLVIRPEEETLTLRFEGGVPSFA
jgi:hypothetical protein